jgi:hypothetical protein
MKKMEDLFQAGVEHEDVHTDTGAWEGLSAIIAKEEKILAEASAIVANPVPAVGKVYGFLRMPPPTKINSKMVEDEDVHTDTGPDE